MYKTCRHAGQTTNHAHYIRVMYTQAHTSCARAHFIAFQFNQSVAHNNLVDYYNADSE